MVEVGGFIALPILRTVDDELLDLIEFAADRSVVLVFCHGCAATLRAYAEALPRIEAAGGTMVAVSPDRPGAPFGTARGEAFAAVVDEGDRFAESLGLVAAAPDARPPAGRNVDLGLPVHKGGEGHEPPVPATYVLAPCGRVTWAHVDPDATRRADPDGVVAALERLAVGPADRGRTASGHAWESIL